MTATLERQEEIERRVARFQRSRHARDLWPDIPLETFRAGEAELARVASAVLGGAPAPVPIRCDLGPRALGVAAFASGVGPLFGSWCETGRVSADAAVASVLATHLEHGRRRYARLRHELERVLVAMSARGIAVWLLKGMHTGPRYFPEPGARASTDVDLLVQPADWVGAREVLTGLGLVETRHPTQPRDSAWAEPGVQRVRSLAYVHADGPWSVDLHQSLDRLPFEGLETGLGAPAPTASEVWEEYCRPVRVLAQPLLLTYLALHASSHFYSMMQVRLIELVLVVRRDFVGYPERWAAFADLVARTRSGRFIFPAVNLAERLVPGTFDRGVMEQIAEATPKRLRRIVGGLTPASAQHLHPYPSLRERFVWLGSPREAMAAVWWLVWPRENERPVPPHRAVAAQWRRVRRVLRRLFLARVAH